MVMEMDKLLLVDDEEAIVRVLSISLKSDGYTVIPAYSGKEGLEQFEKESPPIVLTDLKMPGMSGIELLRKIKELNPDTEVIVITGHGDMDSAIDALRNGASDFINKPVRDEALAIALKRAQEKGLVEINTVNIRQFALNKHLQVDDYPYGGGAGMVLKADVLGEAIENSRTEGSWVIYMSPQGKLLDQAKVKEIAGKKHLIILCGHYEGVDERVMDVVDEEISIGDYILTGGELPAMVLVDAVVRLIPGVLGDRLSAQEESFSHKLLEYPHYTRPAAYKGKKVPEVLLSGHHEKIRLWRKKQSLLSTLLKRPELLLDREYDEEERALLEEILFSGGSKE